VCNFQRVFIRRMCCTVCHVDAPRRHRCSTYLSDHPGTNTRPCLVDSSETNGILIGVKQKKNIINNNKKIHVFHNSSRVMRAGVRCRETRNHDENIVISSHARSCCLSLPPSLGARLTIGNGLHIYNMCVWVCATAAHDTRVS